jgi:hypothetical protein
MRAGKMADHLSGTHFFVEAPRTRVSVRSQTYLM